MSLDLIYEGDYGQPIEMTIKDVDTGQAADISGYSSLQELVFTKPDGSVVAKTAEFVTDGTDGKIDYTTESGFLTEGFWEVVGRVAAGAAVLTSEVHRFKVLPQISVS